MPTCWGGPVPDGAEENHQTDAGGRHNEAGQPETATDVPVCNALTLAQILLSGRS